MEDSEGELLDFLLAHCEITSPLRHVFNVTLMDLLT